MRSSRPSQKGQLRSASGRGSGAAAANASGRSARPGGEDRPQAGELVDPDLGSGQDGSSLPAPPEAPVNLLNALIISIGTGKTIVVFWFTPISSNVCR